jgi:recombination protein RecR
MQLLPKSLQTAIEALGKLPGVGSRSAERYALYLLKNDASKAKNISAALEDLHNGVGICPVTFAFIDSHLSVSPIYSDPTRDKTIIAVVAEAYDVIALEKTSIFKGTYHVLGGLISPIDGVTPDRLHIAELLSRIESDNVIEIILATNASVEGETTALYLQRQLEESSVKITRLARGMPVGLDLEFADQLTLSRALEGRQFLQ